MSIYRLNAKENRERVVEIRCPDCDGSGRGTQRRRKSRSGVLRSQLLPLPDDPRRVEVERGDAPGS